MMKYLLAIASLASWFIPLPVVLAEAVTEQIAPELRHYGRAISVKIISNNSIGSGVIIGKRGDRYLVWTNNHVVEGSQNLAIETVDNKTHAARTIHNAIDSNDDSALVEFESPQNYAIASLNTAAKPVVKQNILSIGYSSQASNIVVEPGYIDRVLPQTLKEGYQVGYTSQVVRGMSGGAILNIFGDLVGINGKSSYPISNRGYSYEDGTVPTESEIEQMRKLSWGIPLSSLLLQLDPKTIEVYKLPVAISTNCYTVFRLFCLRKSQVSYFNLSP